MLRINVKTIFVGVGIVGLVGGASNAETAEQSEVSKNDAADLMEFEEQEGPELSSHIVNINKCPVDGVEGTHRCAPVLGYAVIETRSEMSDFRLVVSEREHFQTFVEPLSCDKVKYAPEIEYRLYEGRPFAVLQQVDCFDPEATGKKAKRPVASHLVIRGLKGFESLDGSVKIKARQVTLTRRAAYKKLDAHIVNQWPELSQLIQEERERALKAIEARPADEEHEDEVELEEDAVETPVALGSSLHSGIVVVIDVSK